MKFKLFLVLILSSSFNLFSKLLQKSPDPKLTNILKWVRENGGEMDKIEIKYLNENNRFVVAKSNIKKGEVVNSIPDTLIISKRHKLISPLCEILNKEDDHTCLTVYLCNESKKSNSFFKPYLDNLPNDYKNYPYFYNEEEIKLCQGSSISAYIDSSRVEMKNTYDRLKQQGVEINFTLDEFAKCFLMMSSRDYLVSNYIGNIPVSDLFNYQPGQMNTKWFYDENEKVFKIVATKDIDKGNEIYVDYGYQDNFKLLYGYGFTLNEKSQNRLIEFQMGKIKMSVPYPLELKQIMKYFRKNVSPTIISLNDEINALNIFIMVLNEYLNTYPTKLEDDLKQQNYTNEYNIQNIYKVIIEEKTVS